MDFSNPVKLKNVVPCSDTGLGYVSILSHAYLASLHELSTEQHPTVGL